jgi:hypothetical protein
VQVLNPSVDGQSQGGLTLIDCVYNVSAGHVAGTVDVWARNTSPQLGRKADECMTVGTVIVDNVTMVRTAQTVNGTGPNGQLCLPASYSSLPAATVMDGDWGINVVTYHAYVPPADAAAPLHTGAAVVLAAAVAALLSAAALRE